MEVAMQGLNNTSTGGSIEGNSSTIILSDQTYNNSMQTTNLTATFASEAPTDAMASWSSDVGLDTYLTSSVTAALPLLSANNTADSAARSAPLGRHSQITQCHIFNCCILKPWQAAFSACGFLWCGSSANGRTIAHDIRSSEASSALCHNNLGFGLFQPAGAWFT